MRALTTTTSLAITIALLGCQGTPAVLDPATETSLQAVLGPAVSATGGMTQAAIGVYQVAVEPETQSASLTPLREVASQGDLYLLSVRPFFGPRDVKLVEIKGGTEPGLLEIMVRFSHPFERPDDLDPPASATKRIDLHIFDVTALVVADGTDTFDFGSGPIRCNGNVLRNADGYRDPGSTFDRAALGIANADIFPYRLVAANIEPGSPLGTYDPFAGGWTGGNLLSPSGYDVFPQGGSADVMFELDATSGPISFTLVPVAKYMDPRSTPNPKSKRLPIAGDPTSLQYVLPEAAGDIQRITCSVSGELTGGSSTELATIDTTILDWDHDATVASGFPNNANLGEISEPSQVVGVSLSCPTLLAVTTFSGTTPVGPAPQIGSTITVNNADAYDPTVSESVLGLVRVQDMQDGDNATDPAQPVALDENLAPTAALESTRYQIVRIPVNPAMIGGVVTPDPVPGTGINPDMGSTIINLTYPTQPQLLAVEGNGEAYFGVVPSSGSMARIYRSTDDGRTWPNPAAVLNSFASGLGIPSGTGWSLGVLATGFPCFAMADSGADLTYLACTGEAGTLVNYGPANNGVEIESAGTWRTPTVLASESNTNLVYIVARNTSATLGANPNRISLYQSTNAAAVPPTFTLMTGYADELVTELSSTNLAAAIDSANNVHIVWETSGIDALDEIYYRKWNHGSPGSWAGPAISLTAPPYIDGGVRECFIAINSEDEPVVVWAEDIDGNTADLDVFLTKYTTGTGWSLPLQVNNGGGAFPATNNVADAKVAIDGQDRIHVIWDDDRDINAITEIWAAVMSPDGATKIVDDFAIMESVSGMHHNNGRLAYSAYGNRLIVTALGVWTAADGRARYQTYTITPP